MNRMDEYQNLIQELEQPVPALEQTLYRAHQKAVRRHILHSAGNLAASFLVFVMLVNFCTPVAYACSKIPLLRDLAEAVTFSRSLSDAVEHEYAQPLSLSQENSGVTASLSYLIVDQKQVNVFFRLTSDTYQKMGVNPRVRSADGGHPEPCSYGLNDWDVPSGELQSITIDFIDGDVPDSLRLQLDIRNMEMPTDEEPLPPEASANDTMFDDFEEDDMNFIAHFDFLLEFDPEFTAVGRQIQIQQTVVLDGQEITFTDMEIYPSHLRVNIADSLENTAWLKSLDFYIETDNGRRFDALSNGVIATGSIDSPTLTSFRADSSYFYEAEQIKLVITGAEWLKKDMEKVYVNLQTGETGQMPEGVTLYSATKEPQGWLLEFHAAQRSPGHQHQLFAAKYYDLDGKMHEINTWGTASIYDEEGADTERFGVTFPLKNYFSDEVWLCPQYSHVWTAQKPIIITVQ